MKPLRPRPWHGVFGCRRCALAFLEGLLERANWATIVFAATYGGWLLFEAWRSGAMERLVAR